MQPLQISSFFLLCTVRVSKCMYTICMFWVELRPPDKIVRYLSTSLLVDKSIYGKCQILSSSWIKAHADLHTSAISESTLAPGAAWTTK